MPQQFFDKFQKVESCSTWPIFKTSKHTCASSLLAKLHWLLILCNSSKTWISSYFHVLWCSLKTALPYLSDLFHLYIRSSSLCFSADLAAFHIPVFPAWCNMLLLLFCTLYATHFFFPLFFCHWFFFLKNHHCWLDVKKQFTLPHVLVCDFLINLKKKSWALRNFCYYYFDY